MPFLRRLPTSCLTGDWQMAIDGWLLEQRAPAFRLYRWERPTLSLGFHQRSLEAHWGELAASGMIDLIRRPSGGRAVLHAGELTYALVWPEAVASREQAYAQACGWLLEAFARMGLPLEPGRQAPSSQRSNCFATSTPADLVHGCGAKRIGSAQLWRSGCLLQHGSILLDPPSELWELVFGTPPPRLPSLPLDASDLEILLTDIALASLPTAETGSSLCPLDAAELARIAACRSRYGVEIQG
ncbi:MAG: hypothetical protein RLZZ268_1532 [Cyanobacteriota bacterium]|jgi:lipoate-protein ligase A